jgi:segregation and condensation protein A
MGESQDTALPVGYQVRLPLFEGPLDLLLHLIEQEELDITKVALAQVTDQYLSYLSMLTEVQVENLTDFLVVAARLLLIKSQALLPKPPPSLEDEEEEDLGDQLARQLRQYKQYRQIAELLSERETAHLIGYLRLVPPPKIEPKLTPGDVSLDELLLAAREAFAVRPAVPDVDRILSPVTVTIGQQMDLIRSALAGRREVSFRQLLHEAASKVEVIVTLMAVLELIKQHVVDVRQGTRFGDVTIFAVGGVTPADALERQQTS